MIEQFEKGKRYIFCRKLLEKWCTDIGMLEPSALAQKIDKQEVTVVNNCRAEIDSCSILPRWCEEVVSCQDLED